MNNDCWKYIASFFQLEEWMNFLLTCKSINNSLFPIFKQNTNMLNIFVFGRLYQLVINRSKAVGLEKYRRHRILNYIKGKSEYEIIMEGLAIAKTYNNKNMKRYKSRQTNGWHSFTQKVPKEHMNNFYLGRCLQFVLDSSNKKEYSSLLIDEEQTINEAHNLRKLQVKKYIDNGFHHVWCGSIYLNHGEEGCNWTIGKDTCDCEFKRYWLEEEDITNLDQTCCVSLHSEKV